MPQQNFAHSNPICKESNAQNILHILETIKGGIFIYVGPIYILYGLPST